VPVGDPLVNCDFISPVGPDASLTWRRLWDLWWSAGEVVGGGSSCARGFARLAASPSLVSKQGQQGQNEGIVHSVNTPTPMILGLIVTPMITS
jgi:hypothetical protein